MKIGAVSLGWGKTSLPQVFQELSQLGGECVEVNGRPGLHDGLVLNEETCPQVLDWAAEAGLEVVGVSGYSDFAQTSQAAIDEQVEILLSSCRAASLMGLHMVRAFVGEPKPETGKTLNDFWPGIVAAFKTAAQAAAEMDVTLGIENHGHLLNNGPDLVRLLEDVNAPNLGITLDTGNFRGTGRSLAQHKSDVKLVLPHVVNVHIKDGIWDAPENRTFVPPGDGELDIAGTLADLVTQGYTGPVYSEYEGPDEFLSSTRKSVAYLKQIRDQVVKK